MTNTLNNLKWRYATKRYDTTKQLSADQGKLIMEALRLSPSSFGLQAWKFIHVTDPAVREKLKAAGYNQAQITEASHFFVLASVAKPDEAYVDKFIQDTATTRGVSADMLKGYKDTIWGTIKSKNDEQLRNWTARQVYIALGVALSAAAENHIDASPMEGFDTKKFDEILGLGKLGLESQVLLAVGFRSPDDKTQHDAKSRFPASEVFIEV